MTILCEVFLILFFVNTIHSQQNLLPSGEECGYSESGDRIVGGNITEIGEFPWLALLSYKKDNEITRFKCGGSLINNRYILTAAHCVAGTITTVYGNVYQIRLGEWDINTEIDCPPKQGCNEPPVDVNVEKIIVHEDYLKGKKQERRNDIALLRLNQPVAMTEFISPICLPTKDVKVKDNDIVFAAGWGINDTVSGNHSTIKLKVDLKIYNQARCSRLYGRQRLVISERQLCAGGEKGKDSCQGDSGGPLMKLLPNSARWYMEGIVSFGPSNCGTQGVPGIYTKVSEYLDWIRSKIEP